MTGAGSSSYDLQANVGYLLRRAQQCAAAAFLQADDTGLSVIQFATLASLVRSGPDSQNSLGRSVGSDAATMTGVVQRLERRGLVAVRADPADRRMKTVSVTEDGRVVYERGVRASEVASEAVLAVLSPGERMLLTEMLRRVVSVEEQRPAG